MEVLGLVPSAFRFPFFPASAPNMVAFRRPPPAFRLLPPPYLSHVPSPQHHGNRGLTSHAGATTTLPTLPEPVEGESRAILRDFLTEHGMRCDLAERNAASWDDTVELLSSKLRILHESEKLLGVQLAQPQLTDLFTPYLRSLLKECEDVRIIGGDEQLSEGCPPPPVLHLMDFGLDLRRVRSMIKAHPSSVRTATIKQKLDCVMEFLISLDVPKSDVHRVLSRCPQLLVHSFEKTIIPAMVFLESKGVDKAMWPKIICNWPAVLVPGKAKVEAIVCYFSEMGLSAAEIGMIISHHPQILPLSIEGKIRLATSFFLDNGFTMEEIRIILLRSGRIFAHNLERNLKPKWDFFLTMGYTRSDLVQYPLYFSFDLEKRIKPRYELATKLGIRWSLSYLLYTTDAKFWHAIDRHETVVH